MLAAIQQKTAMNNNFTTLSHFWNHTWQTCNHLCASLNKMRNVFFNQKTDHICHIYCTASVWVRIHFINTNACLSLYLRVQKPPVFWVFFVSLQDIVGRLLPSWGGSWAKLCQRLIGYSSLMMTHWSGNLDKSFCLTTYYAKFSNLTHNISNLF